MARDAEIFAAEVLRRAGFSPTHPLKDLIADAMEAYAAREQKDSPREQKRDLSDVLLEDDGSPE